MYHHPPNSVHYYLSTHAFAVSASVTHTHIYIYIYMCWLLPSFGSRHLFTVVYGAFCASRGAADAQECNAGSEWTHCAQMNQFFVGSDAVLLLGEAFWNCFGPCLTAIGLDP